MGYTDDLHARGVSPIEHRIGSCNRSSPGADSAGPQITLRLTLSSTERGQYLPRWLHDYNWHRQHGSLNHETPITTLGLSADNLMRLHTWPEYGPSARWNDLALTAGDSKCNGLNLLLSFVPISLARLE